MDKYATIVNQLDKDRYGRPADVKTAEEKKQQKAKVTGGEQLRTVVEGGG